MCQWEGEKNMKRDREKRRESTKTEKPMTLVNIFRKLFFVEFWNNCFFIKISIFRGEKNNRKIGGEKKKISKAEEHSMETTVINFKSRIEKANQLFTAQHQPMCNGEFRQPCLNIDTFPRKNIVKTSA